MDTGTFAFIPSTQCLPAARSCRTRPQAVHRGGRLYSSPCRERSEPSCSPGPPAPRGRSRHPRNGLVEESLRGSAKAKEPSERSSSGVAVFDRSLARGVCCATDHTDELLGVENRHLRKGRRRKEDDDLAVKTFDLARRTNQKGVTCRGES